MMHRTLGMQTWVVWAAGLATRPTDRHIVHVLHMVHTLPAGARLVLAMPLLRVQVGSFAWLIVEDPTVAVDPRKVPLRYRGAEVEHLKANQQEKNRKTKITANKPESASLTL